MTAAPRVTGSTGGRQQADAAEVVMLRRPAAYLDSGALELASACSSTPGSALTTCPARWNRGRTIASTGLELFVQDSGGDADERGPEPRPAGRADGQSDPLGADGQARRHHALHPLAGPERRSVQVDLSEHAVQVQVEAGDEVAGPESEARREDARISV